MEIKNKINTEVIESCLEAILLRTTKPNGGKFNEVLRFTPPVRHSNYKGFTDYALFFRTADPELAMLKYQEAVEKYRKELKRFNKIAAMNSR